MIIIFVLEVLSTYNLKSNINVIVRLTNDDERNLGGKSIFDHLYFESRFESGNLRKAIKVCLDFYESQKNIYTYVYYTRIHFLNYLLILDRYLRVRFDFEL